MNIVIKVTTHSHLLSHEELNQLNCVIKMNIVPCHLHEFETELDFCNKIGLVSNILVQKQHCNYV